jgi:hypothetical protein
VIGFEFETAALIDWTNGGLGDKQDAILSHEAGKYFPFTWKVSSDTGKLEIVTEPFDDEAADQDTELDRMASVFLAISRFIDLLLAQDGADTTLTPGNLGDIARLADPGREGVVVTGPTLTTLTASPQATVGFTLDKIWAAASSIVNTNLHIFEPVERSVRERQSFGISLSGMNPMHGVRLREAALLARAEIRQIQQEIKTGGPPGLPPADAYEGFLTIVISYLISGARQTDPWTYYKLIAPLMSRVSLHLMYQDADVLPYAERFFTAGRVLAAAGIGDGSDDGVMLYRQGLTAGKVGPERTAWIGSIRSGEDMLAALDAHFDTGSMSALDDQDYRAANGKKLYQLELRRLPQIVGPQDWASLAAVLYDISRRWRAAT